MSNRIKKEYSTKRYNGFITISIFLFIFILGIIVVGSLFPFISRINLDFFELEIIRTGLIIISTFFFVFVILSYIFSFVLYKKLLCKFKGVMFSVIWISLLIISYYAAQILILEFSFGNLPLSTESFINWRLWEEIETYEYIIMGLSIFIGLTYLILGIFGFSNTNSFRNMNSNSNSMIIENEVKNSKPFRYGTTLVISSGILILVGHIFNSSPRAIDYSLLPFIQGIGIFHNMATDYLLALILIITTLASSVKFFKSSNSSIKFWLFPIIWLLIPGVLAVYSITIGVEISLSIDMENANNIIGQSDWSISSKVEMLPTFIDWTMWGSIILSGVSTIAIVACLSADSFLRNDYNGSNSSLEKRENKSIMNTRERIFRGY